MDQDTPPSYTDIVTHGWIERWVPSRARPYAYLLRLDRPVGTWLLLLPCWWSLTLASEGAPSVYLALLFAVGALLMRGAGCLVNDIYDRDLDRRVERTKDRPLAAGKISLSSALLFLALTLMLASMVLVQFDAFTRALAVASLGLVFTYPLMKRITWMPQLVLGLTFNWGALVGWSAVTGRLELPALLLYAGGVFWTLGYDTLYAHQDKKDDALVGVKSLALKLGDASRGWLIGFYALACAFFTAAGAVVGLGWAFYAVMFFVGAHAVWQLAGWRMDEPANCLQRFQSNRDFGLLLLLALAVGKAT